MFSANVVRCILLSTGCQHAMHLPRRVDTHSYTPRPLPATTHLSQHVARNIHSLGSKSYIIVYRFFEVWTTNPVFFVLFNQEIQVTGCFVVCAGTVVTTYSGHTLAITYFTVL